MKRVFYFILIIGLLAGGFWYRSERYQPGPDRHGHGGTDAEDYIWTFKEKAQRYDTARICVDDMSFTALIADTPEKRSWGLSNTWRLTKNQAMVFIFDQPSYNGFWMKDMRYAIDIIWYDETGEVLYFENNASPDSFPESFGGHVLAAGVIEVDAGIFGESPKQVSWCE